MSNERLATFTKRRSVQPLGLTKGAWAPNMLSAQLVQIDGESGLPEVAVPAPIGYAGALFIQSAPIILWGSFVLTQAARGAGGGFGKLLTSIEAYNLAVGTYNADVVTWWDAVQLALAPAVLPEPPAAPILLNLPIAADLAIPSTQAWVQGVSCGEFTALVQAEWDFLPVEWMEAAQLAPAHASWAGLGRIPVFPFLVSTGIESPDPAYTAAALNVVGVGGGSVGYPPFADFGGSGDAVPCLMRRADYTRAMFDAQNLIAGPAGIPFLIVGLWDDLIPEP